MAVQVLPLNNPLRIAEEAATVDHISGGRFDFGIGRSGFPRAYEIYGVPYAREPGALPGSPGDHPAGLEGRAASATRGSIINSPMPRFPRGPTSCPIRPSAWPPTPTTPSPGWASAACPIFVGLRGMDIPELRVHLQAYRKAWHEAGHAGRRQCLPAYSGLCGRHRAGGDRGALRQRHVLLYAPGGHHPFGPRPPAAPATTEHRLEHSRAAVQPVLPAGLATKVAFGTAARLDRSLHATARKSSASTALSPS